VGKRKYDFAGWVTKNDIKCSDGVTIKHDAFKDNHGQQVPLVWNHNYNGPENILGHVILHNQEQGVYGFGYFNDTKEAENAKALVQHGDISSMSIGARKLKRSGTDIVHGSIYEVSLVLAAANPGAMIETVMQHSEENGDEEKATIYPGTLIHSADDVVEPIDEEDLKHKANTPPASNPTPPANNPAPPANPNNDQTIGDVIDGMTDVQKEAVYALLGMMVDKEGDPIDHIMLPDGTMMSLDGTTQTNTTKHGDNPQPPGVNPEEDELKHKDDTTKLEDKKGDDDLMKHNVFNQKGNEGNNNAVLKHSVNEVLKQAQVSKASSFRDLLLQAEVKDAQGEVITHGINSVEMLFPDSFQSTNGNQPILYNDPNTAYAYILNATNKSPFAKVRTLVADLTEDEARAKGYIKGSMKKEEFFSLIKRQTSPTTVYKKQKLDRDDILDITDFDVVAFMNVEMQIKLKEEIARAVLVGDGRDFSAEDKINEQNIRPIISDNEFFTVHKTFVDAAAFIEAVIKAMGEYRGSGMPDMFIDPNLLADVKLLKDSTGKFLFGDIPSNAAIAARLGVNSIVATTFMDGHGALIVNLRDYTLGAVKGGEVTNFDQFDIDFNQHKYLSETRLSGALTMPKSAIHLLKGATAGKAANNADGGLTYGKREADKTTPAV
jgi:HK97 family phage prohead protease